MGYRCKLCDYESSSVEEAESHHLFEHGEIGKFYTDAEINGIKIVQSNESYAAGIAWEKKRLRKTQEDYAERCYLLEKELEMYKRLVGTLKPTL